jgi:hypothetical protein
MYITTFYKAQRKKILSSTLGKDRRVLAEHIAKVLVNEIFHR